MCQVCKTDFRIDPQDLMFLQSFKAPAPRLCPDCMLVQRLAFRNERTIYKRKCDAPGHTEEMLSCYAPGVDVPVYDIKFWFGDGWDAMAPGKDYDFSKPFFEQFKELSKKLPWPSLFNWNGINSDYCNFTTDNKNCYLVFGGDFNEDCAYSTFNFHSREVLDTYFVGKCELCYELTDSDGCYRVRFGRYAENCTDSMFLYDCVGCNNCVGCVGLRNKSYHIFNRQYSKEDYRAELSKMALNTRNGLGTAKKRFEELCLEFPHRYANIFKSANSTGDNIVNGKNVRNSFEITGPAENLSHVLLGGLNLKDAIFSDHMGHSVELVYDCMGIFENCNKVTHSVLTSSTRNADYSWLCRGCSDIFGCINLRNKQYCILNKQYTKEEYEALLPRIVRHMDEMPYVAPTGHTYRYGDFLPPDLSPFGYNETIASEYMPLDRAAAEAKGFGWREPEKKEYEFTVQAKDLPGSITEVDDAILNETIGCAHGGNCDHHCTVAFRLIPSELAFYRKLDLPLPQLCHSCRHYERTSTRNPLKLWRRKCACRKDRHFHPAGPCPNEFETPYAPARPEIVYCEQCYNSEVT